MMFEWHFEGRSTLPFEHTYIRMQMRANAQRKLQIFIILLSFQKMSNFHM